MQGVEHKSIQNLKNKYEQIVNFVFWAIFSDMFFTFPLQLFSYTYPHLRFCVDLV